MQKMILGCILVLAAVLLFYKLNSLMIFIGDQGWFYLSARDMLLTGNIPLVGIASSHPWLHQGALWTYLLAFVLWLFNFNPVSPVYFTAILGVLTVWVIYIVASSIFIDRVGIIASILYATSPLVIVHARMPYHTSPIPFFTLLLFYSLYKWIKGGALFFPLVIFFLAILYNFEIATAVLSFVVLLVFAYGFWKKRKFTRSIRNKKILSLSFVAWAVPMLPMLIYDFHNGFPQTLKFVVWMGYRIAKFFGFPSVSPAVPGESLQSFISFTATKYQQLVFLENSTVAFAIFIFSFGWVLFYIYKSWQRKNIDYPYMLLFLMTFIPILGFLVNRTSSEAYMPVLFPSVILLTAVWLNNLMQTKISTISVWLVVVLIAFVNAYTLVSKNYLMGKHGYGPAFIERLDAAKQMVKESGGREYNIRGKGPGSQFESFTMNYTYLTWWLGHGPSNKKQDVGFFINEENSKITVKKNN